MALHFFLNCFFLVPEELLLVFFVWVCGQWILSFLFVWKCLHIVFAFESYTSKIFLLISYYLLALCWEVKPQSICCLFEYNVFSPFFDFSLSLFLLGTMMSPGILFFVVFVVCGAPLMHDLIIHEGWKILDHSFFKYSLCSIISYFILRLRYVYVRPFFPYQIWFLGSLLYLL